MSVNSGYHSGYYTCLYPLVSELLPVATIIEVSVSTQICLYDIMLVGLQQTLYQWYAATEWYRHTRLPWTELWLSLRLDELLGDNYKLEELYYLTSRFPYIGTYFINIVILSSCFSYNNVH